MEETVHAVYLSLSQPCGVHKIRLYGLTAAGYIPHQTPT